MVSHATASEKACHRKREVRDQVQSICTSQNCLKPAGLNQETKGREPEATHNCPVDLALIRRQLASWFLFLRHESGLALLFLPWNTSPGASGDEEEPHGHISREEKGEDSATFPKPGKEESESISSDGCEDLVQKGAPKDWTKAPREAVKGVILPSANGSYD